MKILYGADNRLGANLQLQSLLNNCKHEIKFAAYFTDLLEYIDWTLNAVKTYDDIIGEIVDWGPDLVISDFEPITAKIASVLGIELWYCSPVLLGYALELPPWVAKYKKADVWSEMPGANRYLIYSPFGDIKGMPKLDKYEWVRPYNYNITKNFIDTEENSLNKIKLNSWGQVNEFYITFGETNVIAPLIYDSQKIIVFGDASNPESIFNGYLVDKLGLGVNIGNIRKEPHKLKDYLEYNKNFKLQDMLNIKNHLKLNEMFEMAP